MGVRIIEDKEERMAVLYCSTTMWTFGPVFYENDSGDKSAGEMALAFVRWLPLDARCYTQGKLRDEHNKWGRAAVGVEE